MIVLASQIPRPFAIIINMASYSATDPRGNRSKTSLVDSLFNRSKSSLHSSKSHLHPANAQAHGGYYRRIDLNTPFVPSPQRAPPYPLPSLEEGQVTKLLRGSTEHRSSTIVRVGRKITKLSKTVLKNRNKSRAVAHTEYLKNEHHHRVARYPSPLPLREWKAYGYYAKPLVNGIFVDNVSTARPPPPPGIDPAAIFASLVEQGVRHPERWIPGLEHPALPRRPPGWETPDLTLPQPFPFELSLNPLFYARPCPIRWNMSYHRTDITYAEPLVPGGDEDAWIPLNPTDLAQPATHPRVPFMHVTVVSDDNTSPVFPWPFWVKNPHGITVRDVFNQIAANFQAFVSATEYYSWSSDLRFRVDRACIMRNREASLRARPKEGDDHVKRIDFLCGSVMFSGLKPHPDGEGWVLSVRQRTPREVYLDRLMVEDDLPPNMALTDSPVPSFVNGMQGL